jgi:hypothetical protein
MSKGTTIGKNAASGAGRVKAASDRFRTYRLPHEISKNADFVAGWLAGVASAFGSIGDEQAENVALDKGTALAEAITEAMQAAKRAMEGKKPN